MPDPSAAFVLDRPRDAFSRPDGLPAVPIVLGVVGHRDLRSEADRRLLTDSLRDLFLEFAEAYRQTPLLVVTSMAEGADQVAADAAVEAAEIARGRGLDAGIFLRVPLPFEPSVYARSTSFDSPEARGKLEEVLGREDVESYVVPVPGEAERSAEEWLRVAGDKQDEARKEARHVRYAATGSHLVRRCHALVALWDGPGGSASRGPSGTAEHVDMTLRGKVHDRHSRSEGDELGYRGERGLVVVLHTPRAGSPDSETRAGTRRVYVPHDRDEQHWWSIDDPLPLARRLGPWARFWRRCWASFGETPLRRSGDLTPRQEEEDKQRVIREERRRFQETCTNIDDFNADVGSPAVARKLRTDRLQDERKLLAEHFDEQENRWLRRISRIRLAASEVTGQAQDQLEGAGVWADSGSIRQFFYLLALSLAAYHLYAHWVDHGETHRPILLAVHLALLLAAILVIFHVWFSRLEERRLDGRALAEALRIRRAWALCGSKLSVADSYLGQLRGEMSWVRQALLQACPPTVVWSAQWDRLRKRPGDETPDRQRAMIEKVQSEWVSSPTTGQRHHFEKRRHEAHRSATRLRRFGLILAVLGWLSLLVFLFLPPFLRGPAMHPPGWMLIAPSMLVIGGGLMIAYCERRAFEDLAKQYERMAIVFSNGDLELKDRLKHDDLEGARRVIEALGREAIQEHAQWLILRRARPLELHIGG